MISGREKAIEAVIVAGDGLANHASDDQLALAWDRAVDAFRAQADPVRDAARKVSEVAISMGGAGAFWVDPEPLAELRAALGKEGSS